MKHYYGDLVRRFFVLGAVIIAIGLPFFAKTIPEPIFASVVGLVVIGVAAGLTSPFLWSAILNLVVSFLAVLVFEYYAILTYLHPAVFRTTPGFFWTNQLLVVNFLFALYFSIKTVRGVGGQREVFEDDESAREKNTEPRESEPGG